MAAKSSIVLLPGTAAGLKLRLRMLKSAMRKGTVALARGGGGYGRSDSADNLAPGRYSLRERRAAAGALAESALLTGALYPLNCSFYGVNHADAAYIERGQAGREDPPDVAYP